MYASSSIVVQPALTAGRTADLDLQLYHLLILNLALQLFDGVATYQGLRLGLREANPLLVAAFELVGAEPALVLFKAVACGLLVLLRRTAPARVGILVMRGLAAVYCVLSLGPWLAKYAAVATTLL